MRGCKRRFLGVVVLAWLGSAAAWSHQPVMDMAPRWEGGFGFQVRHEFRVTDELLDGRDEISNPLGRERRVHKTWLEAIYTYKREVRMTLKIPWVDQERDANVGGQVVSQSGRGIGDAIFAVPLRKYWNLEASTFNLGLTPQLRAPTGSTRDSYPVGDGSWDMGLSASASWEDPLWYTLVDLFAWRNGSGRRGIDEGDEFGLDINLGIHPYHDNARNLGAFLMLDVEGRIQDRGVDTGGTTGGSRVSVGPILVLYKDNVMLRGEVKFPVHERVAGVQLSRGILYQLGLGVTF